MCEPKRSAAPVVLAVAAAVVAAPALAAVAGGVLVAVTVAEVAAAVVLVALVHIRTKAPARRAVTRQLTKPRPALTRGQQAIESKIYDVTPDMILRQAVKEEAR